MSNRIELSELETFLYASADILRGHVEASDYKSYVFPLLFFKRICDVYDEETEEYVGGVEVLSGKIADLTKTAKEVNNVSTLYCNLVRRLIFSICIIVRSSPIVYPPCTTNFFTPLLQSALAIIPSIPIHMA